MKSLALACAALAWSANVAVSFADSPPVVDAKPAVDPSTRPAIVPKTLSNDVGEGLTWLVKMQRADGGWSQGEESNQMRSGQGAEDAAAGEPSNVADTCMATLALIRAGSTAGSGTHADNISRSLAFVCGKIEQADAESLWITDVRNTRTQGKLGTYVDTYLAALLLGEAKTSLPPGELADRVAKALDKTIDKMQRNDAQQNGERGWAVALSRGIRGKAMNKAAAAGAAVDLGQLADANESARATVVGGEISGTTTAAGAKPAEFAPAADAAGIGLYGAASSIQQLQAAVDADRQIAGELRVRLGAPTTSPSDREDIARKLGEIDGNADRLRAAREAVVGKMADDGFVAGFGSNGGEEFLSYWAIGESLVTERDEAFASWDKKMTENLQHVQNDDGSWSGHHCITGKTFCTSAALLVLTVDRTTVGIADKAR